MGVGTILAVTNQNMKNRTINFLPTKNNQWVGISVISPEKKFHELLNILLGV